jgi:hypothetical protein
VWERLGYVQYENHKGDGRVILTKFVDWCQYAAVMQREAVTLKPSFSGGGNVVVT